MNLDAGGNPKALRANLDLSFTATGTAGSIVTDTYMVEAFNAAGSTYAYVGAARPDYSATLTATGGPTFTLTNPGTTCGYNSQPSGRRNRCQG